MAEEIIKKIAEKMNMDLPEALVEQEYRVVLQRLLLLILKEMQKKEILNI